ncbi:hypothetical protein OC842_004461 [Tilletia horrida]|uniref:Potassium transporter n=1 Tax=Tilletia horrida TaxID=155126 RepID=A0AAN6JJV6_9BASI|nr:hypothetical protein OC842_004461 [Tilletia horrida]
MSLDISDRDKPPTAMSFLEQQASAASAAPSSTFTGKMDEPIIMTAVQHPLRNQHPGATAAPAHDLEQDAEPESQRVSGSFKGKDGKDPNHHHQDRPPNFGATDGEEGNNYDRARVKIEPTGWALAVMGYRALGVVYGDLGTSPLYVLNGIFPADGPIPSQEDVIGIISCIVWIFTIVVILKYALIVLNFGTGEGEGGTFALYQGLFPKSQIDDENDAGARTRALTFISTKSLHSNRSDRRDALLKYSWVKPALLALALFGSALTLADGVLTPAVSVISAAEGLAIVDTSLTRGDIDGISIAILLVLIAIQSLGVRKLGFIFSPAVLAWMFFLFVTGVINVVSFPGIWRAWDPSRAIMYFVRTGNFDAFAGVLLSVTGTEALFAAIGQLSVRAIRTPLICIVYPSLMLAYLGQGAKLIDNPAAVLPNIFYLSVPGGQNSGAYWIGFITGLLATIIASQALLSASFSIVGQLSHMRCLPPMRMIHTSESDMGPVYVPVVNIALGIGIVIAVAAFESSARLLNAYGFSVSSVMIVTTIEIALQIYYVKRKPLILAVLFCIGFGFVDALLWGATLKKIPHGAWFSFAIGLTLWIGMMFYSWATSLVSKFDAANRIPLSSLLRGAPTASASAQLSRSTTNKSGAGAGAEEDEDEDEAMLHAQRFDVDADLILASLDGTTKRMKRMPVAAVFWKPAGGPGVPHAFAHFLSRYPAAPQVVVFLSLRVLAVPRIPRSHRILVSKTRRFAGFYGVTLRLGYLDEFDLKEFSTDLIQEIYALEKSIGPERGPLLSARRRRLRAQRPQALNQLHSEAVAMEAAENSYSNSDDAEVEAEFTHRLETILAAGECTTHVYPSYYVLARPLAGSLRQQQERVRAGTGVDSPEIGGKGNGQSMADKMAVLRALPITAVDYVRAFLLEEIYRRVLGIFKEEDGPFSAREEVVRVQVSASV